MSVDELKKLPIENRLFINGEFIPSRSGKKFDVSELEAMERGAYLYKLADALKRHLTEIYYLDAISIGKPIHNDLIMDFAIKHLRYFTSKATLITGNTIVLKTSEKAPLSPLVIAQCYQEIGFPKGILNILNGFGQPCGEAIARHMDIRKLSFTGSTNTSRAIKKAAAKSNLKNVTLELGGKSPFIIFNDADIEKAATASAYSILVNSSQMYIASSRVFIHSKIANKFTDALKGALNAMGTSGDPLATGTLRRPQADKLQFHRILEFVNRAKEEGLEIVTGGNRKRDTGYFIQPTIIKNAPEDSKVFKEEIFGPILSLNVFNDEEKVLQSANNTEFSLYASVFTKDISRALRFSKKFKAGNIGINCSSPMMTLDMPFGGWKQSGEGCENSKYAMDNWTELKSVYIAL
ncbi:aldehyde dehydrogenase [Ilyonectria destructans]|nr:aldehyde dehydrogenase [Ilyonectria destructans]